MVRSQLALFAACVLCLSVATAEDKPNSAPKVEDKDKPAAKVEDKAKPEVADPIAAALKTSKDTYQAAVGKANEKLLAAFADCQKRLENDTKLKVEKQIKLVEEVQEEKKAFEADPSKLPKSAGMKVAVSEYQKKTALARTKCEEAFEKAAEAYRAKKPPDLTSAKATLTAKTEFTKGITVSKPEEQRIKWVYTEQAWFRVEKDGEWVERSGDKNGTVFYKFKETAKTKDCIELYDSERNIAIRLYSDHCDIKNQRQAWKLHLKGKWGGDE